MGGSRRILVAACAATAALNQNATAAIRVVVVPPDRVPGAGAQGLLVPGHGASVERAAALLRLPRGSAQGPDVTIYVSLPPPGRHHNVVRYPLAFVGGGYGGLLVDERTRLPGLVGIGDLEATVEALAEGRAPPITSRAEPNARGTLARLDRELAEVHDARTRANVALAALLLALASAALVVRSGWLARASVLVAPAMLALGLAWRSALVLFFAALALALVFALPRRAFMPLCWLVLGGALLVLWQWPETNSLATIGPHPDGGGRFYGVTNQVETLLLPSALAAGLAAAPLALAAIGWSRAGADGGGIVVYAAAYAMLGLRAYGRVTWRRLAVAASVVLVLGLVFVAVDAVTGGSSHVTRAFDGSLFGDLAHRWNVSWHGITRSLGSLLLFASGVALLARLTRVRPRPALLDAMLVALVVSLVVNDSPQDVAFWGALGALSLLALERSR